MKRMKIVLVGAALLVLLSVFAGCSKADKEETIRFAVVAPMTGDSAQQGAQYETGAKLATQEINAKGGINGKKLVFDVYDDQANPNQAVLCAEKIVADGGYRFVISSVNSGCTIAAHPTYKEADMALISGTNTSDLISELGFRNFVRPIGRDTAAMVQILELGINAFGIKKPAIIYAAAQNQMDAAMWAKQWVKQKYNIDFVSEAQIQAETEKDYSAYITKFIDMGVDGLYIFTEYSPAALALKQMYSFGWNVPVIALNGATHPQLIEIAGVEAAEGFIGICAFDPTNPKSNIQQFVKDYSTLSGGILPGEWGAGAYDSTYIMAQALSDPEGGKLSGEALISWMKTNTNYSGALGDVHGFDINGDNPSAQLVILKVHNGQWVVY
jgi:branched-chain amino acid transport system substrate-binding protein